MTEITSIDNGFRIISNENIEIDETFNSCKFLKYEHPFVIYYQNDEENNKQCSLMVFSIYDNKKTIISNNSNVVLKFVTYTFICYAIDNDLYYTSLWYPNVSFDKEYPEYSYTFGDRFANIENNDEYCKEKIIAHDIEDLQKYVKPYESNSSIRTIIFENSICANEIIDDNYDKTILSNSLVFYKKINDKSYDLCMFNYNELINFGNYVYVTSIFDEEHREYILMKQDNNLIITLYDFDEYAYPIYSTKLDNTTYIANNEYFGLLLYKCNNNIVIVNLNAGFTPVKEYMHGEEFMNLIVNDDDNIFKIYFKWNNTIYKEVFKYKNYNEFIIDDLEELTNNEYLEDIQTSNDN